MSDGPARQPAHPAHWSIVNTAIDPNTAIDTEPLRRFIAARLENVLQLAAAAGHGVRPPVEQDSHLSQPDWTRLDLEGNVRPSYDLRFVKYFSPRWAREDVERKVALMDAASTDMLVILANEWSSHPDFQEIWARTPRNGRELGEHLDRQRAESTHL